MSNGVILHPEKGVNSFLTYCTMCGGEASELVMVGANDGVYVCNNNDCGQKHIGRPDGNRCAACKCSVSIERRLKEGERLPASEPCDKCKEVLAEHKKVVEGGGVYFRCKDCGAKGAIRVCDFSSEVRKAHGIEAPGLCGVEFGKEHCPVCNGKSKEGES